MDVSRVKNKYLYLTLILVGLIIIIIVILATYTRPNMCNKPECKQDPGPNFHYDGRWFHVQALLPLPWQKAEEWCAERASRLVKVTPENYQLILHGIVSSLPVQYKPRIWLGAKFNQNKGKWKWVSGTEEHENSPWPRPPRNTTEKHCLDACFEFDKQLSIGTHPCELYQPFVCEFECDAR
ncbi:hypothetical protein Pcinc_038281 [Petrolisthes cinctipes]|uniref:C-type lectin domain-containing protein n=1 Tax=Petrolisthes cinctipes TaxID=88211 RepID=A0AAE1BQV1_PETCI|nr:hypothetical protein Pcinc_038281 [Petrolisthes cinctipes]